MEDIASVIWDELKRYINTVDRAEAAEILVGVLIDNDSSPEDIKSSFKGDPDIKRALADYIEEEEEQLDEDDEDVYDDDD